MMSNANPFFDDRAEVLAALRHGIERSLLLASTLADDPAVGAEARNLSGRLEAIQAEVEAIAFFRDRRLPGQEPNWPRSTSIWG
jgi:hypothetical protein